MTVLGIGWESENSRRIPKFLDRSVAEEQDSIGWTHFLEGKISKQFYHIQQAYLAGSQSPMNLSFLSFPTLNGSSAILPYMIKTGLYCDNKEKGIINRNRETPQHTY
jgi:hypothetical protein